MGLGICAWVAITAPSFLALGSTSPSFADAWYRENVLGELAEAGNLYFRIYQAPGDSSSPAAETRSAEIRRRAALRAGECFEKLGEYGRAREAYAWLARNGNPREGAVQYAQLRLKCIPPAGAPPPGASQGAPPGTPQGARISRESSPGLDALASRIKRREDCLKNLSGEIQKMEERVLEERRIERRLQELGMEFQFQPARPVPPEEKETRIDVLRQVDRDLDTEDRRNLKIELADRYYRRGLRALRDSNPQAAVEEFKKTIQLQPSYHDAEDLLRVAEGYLAPMEGVARLATARLEEHRTRRELEYHESLRVALAELDSAPGGDASRERLGNLDRTRSREEWSPRCTGQLTRAEDLQKEADLRLLLDFASQVTGDEPEAVQLYQGLKRRNRRAARDLLRAGEQMADLLWTSWKRGRPILSGSDREDRAGALQRIGEELVRHLARGEEQYQQNPGDLGPEGWSREFVDILILLQWFPELDREQRIRSIAREYLEKRELQGVKKKE